MHKNSKRKPAKALKYEDTRRVVDFILNYSEVHGIMLPGRTPKHWVTDAKLLPTNVTKRTVYEEYHTLCENSNVRCVKVLTFRKLWQQLCPFVCRMLPASDLCWLCQSATYKIAQSANKSDVKKQLVIQELTTHHAIVQQERDFYKSTLQSCEDQITNLGLQE